MNMGSQPEKRKVFYPCLVYISHSLSLLFAGVRLGRVSKLRQGAGDVADPSRVRKVRVT